MGVTFKVFGFTVASIHIVLPETEHPEQVIDRGVKGISRLWVRSMTR